MRTALLLSTAMLAAVAAIPVQAQSTESAVLEEIVVTAQRRSENLQKVAVAVSAVSANALTLRVDSTSSVRSR